MAGCGGSSFTGPGTLPDPKFLFVNGCADTGNLDFYVSDELSADNVGFQNSSQVFKSYKFEESLQGRRDISARPSGGFEEYDRIGQVFNRDTHNVIIAYGLGNTGGDAERRVLLTNVLANTDAVTGNRARLIIFNGLNNVAGSSAPPLRFQSPGDNPQFIADNVNYGTASELSVDSGSQNFEVRRADLDGDAIVATAAANLANGGVYVVLISGVVGQSGQLQPQIAFIPLEE